MTRYSNYNVVYRLQKWMDSVPGQTFLNYAYSWGASIVVLGALFKLTHLPGADLMLFIGMGTEVFVFFISAFDRPFDKSADGMELPTHVTEDYLQGIEPAEKIEVGQRQEAQPAISVATDGGNVATGGAAVVLTAGETPSQEEAEALSEAQTNYVDALKTLTETIVKVQEQCEHLTRDSEEMQNLNRTLTGISTVYEMQLKGVSKQVGTIDQINEQTRRMAEQIEQLNSIYSRMIEAMTVNMPQAAARPQ